MNIRNFGAIAGAVLLASCGGSEAGDGAGAPDSGDSAMRSYMEETVQKTAEVYWGSAGWIVDADGEHDLTPTTEEGWAATLQSTKDMQAIAEELKTPKWAEGRGDDWIVFADGLLEISKQAEQTAIDRDSDAIFEVGGTMYNVCKACHEAYAPEPTEEDAPVGETA